MLSAGHRAELYGVVNKLSTATIGGIVWIGKEQAFDVLPSFLVGAPFFQMRLVTLSHAVMTIMICEPSTIYISCDRDFHGGFDSSLPNDGWIQQKDQIKAGRWSLKRIWMKNFTDNGVTTITLPTLTKSFLGVIFVAGNNFK